jgi:hypothetical protein
MVSKEEWDDWVSQPSADYLRRQLVADALFARNDLLARGLKSSDPDVRAAAERVQSLLEFAGKIGESRT